jgi:hypothetical protein
MAGNMVNAAMMGQFTTFPNSLPTLPAFPIGAPVPEDRQPQVGEPLMSTPSIKALNLEPVSASVPPPVSSAVPTPPSHRETSATIPVSMAIGEMSPKPTKRMNELDESGASQNTPHGCLTPERKRSTVLSDLSPNLRMSPKRTPRPSLKGMKSPSILASPFVICEGGGSTFGFTLRIADNCTLGINTEHSGIENCLTVVSVLPGGAMESWNKACAGGPTAGKAVVPGDKIVQVNGATTPEKMLKECKESKLLKFMVTHGNDDVEED